MTDTTDTDGGRSLEFELAVIAGQTHITFAGPPNAAVVVQSASGERIYLPPSDTDDSTDARGSSQSPYQSPYDTASSYGRSPSPYGTAEREMGHQSSYGTSADQPAGLQRTRDGFRIVHPEPVTDVRLIR